jgi:hypothetical protein
MSSIAHIEPAPGDRPTFADEAAACIPWIGFVFVAGPPVALLAIPLLILGLSLFWPFLLLFTLVAACVALMTAVVLAGALLAAPYMLIRRVRARRKVSADVTASAHLVSAESPRAVA